MLLRPLHSFLYAFFRFIGFRAPGSCRFFSFFQLVSSFQAEWPVVDVGDFWRSPRASRCNWKNEHKQKEFAEETSQPNSRHRRRRNNNETKKKRTSLFWRKERTLKSLRSSFVVEVSQCERGIFSDHTQHSGQNFQRECPLSLSHYSCVLVLRFCGKWMDIRTAGADQWPLILTIVSFFIWKISPISPDQNDWILMRMRKRFLCLFVNCY